MLITKIFLKIDKFLENITHLHEYLCSVKNTHNSQPTRTRIYVLQETSLSHENMLTYREISIVTQEVTEVDSHHGE